MRKAALVFVLFLICSCAHSPVCRKCSSRASGSGQVKKRVSTAVADSRRVLVLYSKPGERRGRYAEPGKGKVEAAERVRKVKVTDRQALFSVGPERVRPFVLRVWIAPWRDSQDRLKWARTVYIDLPINRWNVGIRPTIMDNKKLLEILSKTSGGRVVTKTRRKARRQKSR